MTSRTRETQGDMLEHYQTTLDNAENLSEMAEAMTELGYDGASLAEGNKLLVETRKAYHQNKIENDEATKANVAFSDKKKQLESIYSVHRKKAKVVFRKDEFMCQKLSITGSIPPSYVKKLDTIKRFYQVVSADIDIQSKLARLKISFEDISNAQILIQELESARINYLRKKGESQDATTIKDIVFAKMNDWMNDFYTVAKIALKDRPELLEKL